MRPIKFRAWDKENEESLPPYRILINEEGQVFYVGDSGTGTERMDEDRVVIQLFTGLLDKNGKEIYEGDILAWKSQYTEKVDQASVFWDNDAASFNWKMPALNFNKSGIRHFEVIGNIYENPELLDNDRH